MLLLYLKNETFASLHCTTSWKWIHPRRQLGPSNSSNLKPVADTCAECYTRCTKMHRRSARPKISRKSYVYQAGSNRPLWTYRLSVFVKAGAKHFEHSFDSNIGLTANLLLSTTQHNQLLANSRYLSRCQASVFIERNQMLHIRRHWIIELSCKSSETIILYIVWNMISQSKVIILPRSYTSHTEMHENNLDGWCREEMCVVKLFRCLWWTLDKI